LSDAAQRRLAVYGTLGPGRENHHQLEGLRGVWADGIVRARRYESGWGAALGYPGLVLDPGGEAVAVQVLLSDDLPAHWARLDDFEGDGYRRVVVEVQTPGGAVEACIYVLSEAGLA
jgi:gamma-glutamylcyclotransferase (GGCT)/AIG2-like uncharacterized protein YtfP